MSKPVEAKAKTGEPASPSGKKSEPAGGEVKHEKRTISEIRESKKTGEKLVYMSVPDYTSAQWAELAGVDVAVVGDSLAMIAHGHPNTIPATMDMMVLHAAAVRRGAPNTFVLGCMPYQSYHTVERALANATRFMQEAACGLTASHAASGMRRRATQSSRRAASRRRTCSRRWSTPAFRRPRTSGSRRTPSQYSADSRSRDVPRMPP